MTVSPTARFLDVAEQRLFCTNYRIVDANAIQLLPDTSCGTKLIKALACLAVPGIGWAYGLASLKLVPQGELGMVMNSGRPELLGPGWYCVAEPLRRWSGKVALSQCVIKFTTKQVITVKDGFVGLAWDRGEPVLLPPGMHQWDSPTLKFEKTFDRRSNFQAGPFTFCTVQKGDVGVSFDRGELTLLPAGYHVLKHALHKFSHNISVRQQFDQLKSSKLLSQDTVELDLDATVSWQVILKYGLPPAMLARTTSVCSHCVGWQVNEPEAAALNARDMEHLRELVHRQVNTCRALHCLPSTFALPLHCLFNTCSPTQARAALSECVFKMAVSTGSSASGLSQS